MRCPQDQVYLLPDGITTEQGGFFYIVPYVDFIFGYKAKKICEPKLEWPTTNL